MRAVLPDRRKTSRVDDGLAVTGAVCRSGIWHVGKRCVSIVPARCGRVRRLNVDQLELRPIAALRNCSERKQLVRRQLVVVFVVNSEPSERRRLHCRRRDDELHPVPVSGVRRLDRANASSVTWNKRADDARHWTVTISEHGSADSTWADQFPQHSVTSFKPGVASAATRHR